MGDLVNSNNFGKLRYRIPSTPKQRTACSSACAIASPQLPKHSFFNEPQRHRERAIAPPPTSQTSFFNEPQRHRGHREREIALPQLPKSDSCGALRYRTPSTSPNSELTSQCLRYRTLQLPKQQLSHFINFKHCLF